MIMSARTSRRPLGTALVIRTSFFVQIRRDRLMLTIGRRRLQMTKLCTVSRCDSHRTLYSYEFCVEPKVTRQRRGTKQ